METTMLLPFPEFPVGTIDTEGVRRHCDSVDGWLRGLLGGFEMPSGVALVALGGYGRGEMFPHSDLDLLLACRGKVPKAMAKDLWYPIWDSGIKLGHSVRTNKDTLKLARSDLDTATALLDLRTILGDESVTEELRQGALAQWRKGADQWLTKLADSVAERGHKFGEVSFDLEPEIKNGRGGLRDVHTLRWVQIAQGKADPDDPVLDGAVATLVKARVALHLCSARATEQISVEAREEVARRGGYRNGDALIGAVTSAARVISWQTDEAFGDQPRNRHGLGGALPPGVIRVGERVALDPESDHGPAAALRLAATSTRLDRRMSVSSLDRAATVSPDEPWPAEVTDAMVELLSLGRAAIPAIETLDHAGIWVGLIPEWAPARSRPQHNPYHRYTVDRHLLETVAIAATLQHDRMDLLLWAALLHDLGKAYPGDHSAAGAELVGTIIRRAGYDEDTVETLVMMVQEHLLLPDTATRRDLDDPTVLTFVAGRVGRVDRLRLLAKLSVADGQATGSTAWSPWKEALVADLVERVAGVLEGREVDELVEQPGLDPSVLDDYDRSSGQPRLEVGEGNSLRVLTTDRPGLFSRISGVLALHGLDIRQARVGTVDGVAVEDLEVESAHGDEIPWDAVCRDMRLAVAGGLAISARLSRRASAYPQKEMPHALEPAVRVLDGSEPHRSVVEVVGPDSIGLVYRLTCTLAELDLDITKAMVTTMGTDVIDVFYVESRSGLDLATEQARGEIRLALLHALAAT